MKKLPLILGLVAGGLALLLLSIFLMLAIQGKLNNETLTHMPILGRFFGEPVPIYINPPQPAKTEKEKKAEEEAAHAPKEPPIPSTRFNFPSPYNAQDLTQLIVELKEAKEHYEKKGAEQREKEEDLAKREKDLEQRMTELNQLAAKLEEVRSKIETDMKSIKDGRNNMDADEKEAIQRIADWAKAQEDVTNIVPLIEKLGVAKAVKILDELSSSDEEGNQRASDIITRLKPDFATDVMNLMIKKKKTPTVASGG